MKNILWQELLEQSKELKRKVKKSKSAANADLWNGLFALDINKVKEALDDGANPDCRLRTAKNLYPLNHALQKGALDIADLLLLKGSTFKKNLLSPEIVDTPFIEDRSEVMEWIYKKKGNDFLGSNLFSFYRLDECAGRGNIKCLKWILENIENLKRNDKFSQNMKPSTPLEFFSNILIIIPEDKVINDFKKWSATVKQAFPSPTPQEIEKVWMTGIKKDSVVFLRMLLNNDWLPKTSKKSWSWSAAHYNASKTLKWMMNAPSFKEEFIFEAKNNPSKTIHLLLNKDQMLSEGLITALKDCELLPSLEELQDKNLYSNLFIFKNNNAYNFPLSKTYVELLARKWPAILQVENERGENIFMSLKKNHAQKSMSLMAIAEKIMFKKSFEKITGDRLKEQKKIPQRRL